MIQNRGRSRKGNGAKSRFFRWPRVLLLLVLFVVVIINCVPFSTANDAEESTQSNNLDLKTRKEESLVSHNPRQVKLFSKARRDRSGAAVLDMLMCHAFAQQQEAVYGGACVDKNDNLPHLDGLKRLIHFLGLHDQLPFACPTDRAGIILRHGDYFSQDTTVFSDKWLAQIRPSVGASMPTLLKDSSVLQVAVHVRRGDVTPCSEPERYLPNSYYLYVLDNYIPELSLGRSINVTIYSESSSYETSEPFKKRGYHLNLGTDLVHTWQALISADVLVLSRSAFSFAPALFNQNSVIFMGP